MDSSVLVEPSTGTPVENPLSVIGSGRGTTGGIVSWFYCYMISKIGHIQLYTCMLLMELKKKWDAKTAQFYALYHGWFYFKEVINKTSGHLLACWIFCFMPVQCMEEVTKLGRNFLTQINSRIVWNHTISRSMDLKAALLWTCNCNKHVTDWFEPSQCVYFLLYQKHTTLVKCFC